MVLQRTSRRVGFLTQSENVHFKGAAKSALAKRAMKVIPRFGAWLLLGAIAVFTLSPAGLRPVSGAPADLERVAAYALLGGLFSWGYPRRRVPFLIFLLFMAALLEYLQNFVPGRHGRVEDLLVKTGAVGMGFALLAAGEWIVARGASQWECWGRSPKS